MAAIVDLNEFYYGERITFVLLAKNRDDTVITSPASQVVTMTISTTSGGEPILEVDTASGEITLTDAGTGEFTIDLAPADYAALTEGGLYYFNLWSGITAASRILQAEGQFRIRSSIEPA